MDQQQPEPVDPPAMLAYAPPRVSPVVVVWCRLFALWLFINGLQKLVVDISYFLNRQMLGSFRAWDGWAISLVDVVIWPALGWFCWVEAPRLSLRLANGLAVDELRPVRLLPLLRFSLLSIWVYEVTEALPYVIRQLVSVQGPIHNLGQLPWGAMTWSVSTLLIGVVMIAANVRIAGFLLRRFGEAGTTSAVEPDGPAEL